jgi:pimeloyl-ACP methyl ester carboxylesterase
VDWDSRRANSNAGADTWDVSTERMSKIYESDGARLSFDERGAGLPVVFLHPTPLDHVYWYPMIGDLGGVRAIVPDLRGHGASELGVRLPTEGFARVPNAPVLTMAQLAKDVIALLDYLELQEAVFAGCSIGGYVMLELWRQVPERMRGFAIVCSKAQPDAEANLAKRVDMIERARREGTAAIFDGNAQTLVGATTRTSRPTVVNELRKHMTLTTEAFIAVQTGLAARPNSLHTIPSIDVPILAICGGEDPGITAEEMMAFQGAPGGCEFHLLPNAGHFAAYEQPDKIAALLAPWLRQFDVSGNRA